MGASDTVSVCVFYKIDFYREVIVYTSHQNTAYCGHSVVPVSRYDCSGSAVLHSWLVSSIGNLQNSVFSFCFFTDVLNLQRVQSSGIFSDGVVIHM